MFGIGVVKGKEVNKICNLGEGCYVLFPDKDTQLFECVRGIAHVLTFPTFEEAQKKLPHFQNTILLKEGETLQIVEV